MTVRTSISSNKALSPAEAVRALSILTSLLARRKTNSINYVAGLLDYSYSYIHQVKSGNLPPSKPMLKRLDKFKKKKLRPGAIRLDYPEDVDAHKARARIIEKLTPLARYYALEEASNRKE